MSVCSPPLGFKACTRSVTVHYLSVQGKNQLVVDVVLESLSSCCPPSPPTFFFKAMMNLKPGLGQNTGKHGFCDCFYFCGPWEFSELSLSLYLASLASVPEI